MQKQANSFLSSCVLICGLWFFSATAHGSAIFSPTIRTLSSPFSTNLDFEDSVTIYLNELRAHPAAFYRKYLPPFIKKHPKFFTSRYTQSLKATLSSTETLPAFSRDSSLDKIAQKQADYLAQVKKGEILSHNQGTTSFETRFENNNLDRFAENLFRIETPSPLSTVLFLLVDQGVSSFGHRKNMLNPHYDQVGIGTAKAPNGQFIVVIDFGKY